MKTAHGSYNSGTFFTFSSLYCDLSVGLCQVCFTINLQLDGVGNLYKKYYYSNSIVWKIMWCLPSSLSGFLSAMSPASSHPHNQTLDQESFSTRQYHEICKIRLLFSYLFSIFIETRDWIVCSDDYLAIIFWFLLGRLRWGLNTHQRWRSWSLHTRTRSVSSHTSPLARKWLHLLPLIRKCFHHLIGCWGSKN